MESSFFKQCFELHSDIRLPFEPKGEAVALREEIRRNVKLLKPSEYNHLSARLITSEKAFFDVENVLFYNVGSGAFSHLQLDEISFSLESDSNNQSNKYTYSYELTSEETTVEIHNTILEFSFDIDKFRSDMNPLDYWHAFNQGNIKISKLSNPKEFGLSIVIDFPEKYRNITALIKPLIDGLISSFHYQNSADQVVLNYIAKKKHISEDVVISQLSRKDYAFLGERNLISSYRNGVKWNPEDEKCTKVSIKQVMGLSEKVKISGKAYLLK